VQQHLVAQQPISQPLPIGALATGQIVAGSRTALEKSAAIKIVANATCLTTDNL